jgi:hypothetical protein
VATMNRGFNAEKRSTNISSVFSHKALLPKKALSRAALLSLVAMLSSGLCTTSFADDTYYRWRDDRGRMVVSDRPPTGSIDYEVVSQQSTMIRRVQAGEGAVPAEVESRPGNEFEQVDTRRETMEAIAKNPEACARAQANLETLNTSARIRIRDEATGEPRFLSEDEKETQRQKARDIIRVHCN